MTLENLLIGVEARSRSGGEAALFQCEVTGVQYDSRKIEPGNAFVAIRGETTNGNCYIDSALSKGAVAVMTDSAIEPARGGTAWVRVAHGRRALAGVSANFYGHPATKLRITGVTGTNGKTTTTFLLSQLLRFLDHTEPVLIGTIEYHFANQIIPALRTTPESLELNQIFAQATDPKLEKHKALEAVMEVSSHALEQERVFGIGYDVAVFTNLTRDHLDYHHTMEQYFAAKKILFAGCGAPPPRIAIINADDEHGRRLADFSRSVGSEVMTYGIQRGDFRAQDLEMNPHGTRFTLQTPQSRIPVESGLVGGINVYNLLAAMVAAFARGGILESIRRATAACKSAPGRFERVDCGQPFTVVVDYAHTDDALRNLTTIARQLVSQSGQPGRVITLFGCGGDRDRTKRPLMGAAAGAGSDLIVLTSDNPRSEDPLAIMNEALSGLEKVNARFTCEPDRKKAIALAIGEAREGDIVLIAGKGHEKTQTTREGIFLFDDVQVAREALSAAGFAAVSNRSAQ